MAFFFDLFANGAESHSSALDKLVHSCGAVHLLPVVLTVSLTLRNTQKGGGYIKKWLTTIK